MPPKYSYQEWYVKLQDCTRTHCTAFLRIARRFEITDSVQNQHRKTNRRDRNEKKNMHRSETHSYETWRNNGGEGKTGKRMKQERKRLEDLIRKEKAR